MTDPVLRFLLGLVSIVLVELSAHEFVELQSQSAEALRARFELPRDCEPSVTAMGTPAGAGRLLVLIDCVPGPAVPLHLPGP